MTTSLPLPPNASQLEMSLAVALMPPEDLRNLPADLDSRLDRPNDEELPFHVWEWGLEPVLPYLKDPRIALKDGRPWQKRRGTIGAGDIARAWIDVTADHEQNQGKRFQLHLRNLPSDNRPNEVIALSDLSKSVRNTLVRVTHQLDGRAFQVNGSYVNGLDRVEDWTGVHIEGLKPVVSFASFEHLLGTDTGLSITPTTTGRLSVSTHIAFHDESQGQSTLTFSTYTNLTMIYEDITGPLQPEELSDKVLGLPSELTTFTGA